MEPEKLDYVKEIEKTAIPILEGKADLVVPDRRIVVNEKYFLPHYPTSQQNEELFGDDCWRELTGFDLDVWCGPRTWNKETAKYFLNYNGEYGDKWDSIFIPVMSAILDGKKVKGVKVNYVHPKEQTAFEEGNYDYTIKRFNQLTNLIPAITDYWNKNYNNSNLREIRKNLLEYKFF